MPLHHTGRMLVVFALAWGGAGLGSAGNAADPLPPEKTLQQRMGEQGLLRHRGHWRTPQEIELIERAEREQLAQREWRTRLERLRAQVDKPAQSAAALEELRGISDPFAVPALAAALAGEPAFRVRSCYVESLARIRSQEAFGTLLVVALDHADPETRVIAVERLAVIGPHLAAPPLAAALRDADNARVNRAAEALGRLGSPTAVAALIEALETPHLVLEGDGTPEGSTTATFTPNGGGLALGGGTKRVRKTLRNDRVLEALIALTGANFEWNASAWKAWLANRQLPPPGYDPRRG
jgi:hypothetical protein